MELRELDIERIEVLVDAGRAELVEDLDKVDSEVHLEHCTDTTGLAEVDHRLGILADKVGFVEDSQGNEDRLVAGMLGAVVDCSVAAAAGLLDLKREHFLVAPD